MTCYRPHQIFVEESVRKSPITENVLARLPDVPVKIIDSVEEKLVEAKRKNPTIPRAKQSLVLARHKGRFFKMCPASQTRGDQRNACCNYFVINFASNCHMECTYCYLQSYLNFPYMIIYANAEDLLEELDQVVRNNPERYFRIGTGELADSLALDSLTGYGRLLINYFSTLENAVLELKTKTDCVDDLLHLDHRGRTVVSWSINPGYIHRTNEHKTASPEERLEAAQRCVASGYSVAFHVDPMIHYPEWEEDYRNLFETIFGSLPSRSIAWISLGTLRMTSSLRDLMRSRFPKSFLPRGELVTSEDGKLRYFKPIRVEMYGKAMEWIRSHSPETKVYACMERADVWQKAFAEGPPDEVELGDSLVQVVL